MATMNAWEAMSLKDATQDVADERKGRATVVYHLPTRRQIDRGEKVISQNLWSNFKELRNNLEGLLKENEAMKASRPPGLEFAGGYQRAYENKQETSEDSDFHSGQILRGRDQTFCCHYCSSGDDGAKLCPEFKESRFMGGDLWYLTVKQFLKNTSIPMNCG